MVAVADNESVTSTVKLEYPSVVAVPEMIPVLDPRDNPAGREPAEMLNVYAGVPPEATKVSVKGVLNEADADVGPVIDKLIHWIFRCIFA
jgi:hypothetical protein